jgi:hypothetical protein
VGCGTADYGAWWKPRVITIAFTSFTELRLCRPERLTDDLYFDFLEHTADDTGFLNQCVAYITHVFRFNLCIHSILLSQIVITHNLFFSYHHLQYLCYWAGCPMTPLWVAPANRTGHERALVLCHVAGSRPASSEARVWLYSETTAVAGVARATHRRSLGPGRGGRRGAPACGCRSSCVAFRFSPGSPIDPVIHRRHTS